MVGWSLVDDENNLDRSKLVIHEVDEPPLGVPGELHFDDEEEEVERGGWFSFKNSLGPQICPLSR